MDVRVAKQLSMLDSWPPLAKDLRRDLHTRDARVVEIMTWGKLPFELAHFTDEQLANALLNVSSKSHPKGRTGLIRSINMQRTADPSPDIDYAWKQSGVSKLELADALWPLLTATPRTGPSTQKKGGAKALLDSLSKNFPELN